MSVPLANRANDPAIQGLITACENRQNKRDQTLKNVIDTASLVATIALAAFAIVNLAASALLVILLSPFCFSVLNSGVFPLITYPFETNRYGQAAEALKTDQAFVQFINNKGLPKSMDSIREVHRLYVKENQHRLNQYARANGRNFYFSNLFG